MELVIKGFIETSFLDWDGKVVSTLFVGGCNFRCPFCHNSALVEKPQTFESVPQERIEDFLLRQKDFIDGICVTGGEPLLHKDRGLFEFLRKIKNLGFLVKIDTNGADPDGLSLALKKKLVDYIAMDLKGPLNEKYEVLCGVKADLGKIRQSIKIILESGIAHEFRTTVIPNYLKIEDIEDIAKSIAGSQKFVLQQFVPGNAWKESWRKLEPYLPEDFQAMVKVCRRFIPNSRLRGV
jgi:pyruvate formate lyase activating enzyme